MSAHNVDHNEKHTRYIGIIGMGDMGKLYARVLYQGGWKNICVCDVPANFDALTEQYPEYTVLRDGHLVSRKCDFIMYSVEAKNIDRVVSQYGPSTKVGAVVSEPEIAAFERWLPDDVHIVSCHSLHGPSVPPKGQPLVVIRHRADDSAFDFAVRVLQTLESNMVYLSFKEHDRITADTQAVTHLAFKSMGTAWKSQTQFPWEESTYVGGIENAKVAMMLRIYSNKYHVYAGLALLNPSAKVQIRQYASSVTELFKLMIQERHEEFAARVHEAGAFVFGATSEQAPILLSDDVLDQYSLSPHTHKTRRPNSHLSLLAMVDCWYQLKIKPYDHLICQTPPFRLWLGITEYLFRTKELFQESLQAAIHDKLIRADDMEFCKAVCGWADVITQGHFDSYQARFEDTQRFFDSRLEEGKRISAKVIEMVTRNTIPERKAV
ncbi:prephenate dehydrogenase (NADP(+)) [Sorochytrium milnesiophthora]